MKTSYPIPRPVRTGFTLVELLVAITVVAILVGMLTAAVIPALRRGREAAVQMEMKQIELAIENFKNQYGFYPPSFEGIHNSGTTIGERAAVLLRYVNRMSPNHAETTPIPSGPHMGETRLFHWYEQIGRHLDQESSLVFWLSGICKNKQFPITGGRISDITDTNPTTRLPSAHSLGNDGIERDVFFEFKAGQIYGDESVEPINVTTTGATITDSDDEFGYVLKYAQQYGPQDGDLTFKYRDAAISYNLGTVGSLAYYVGPADGSQITDPVVLKDLWANPKSFQLVTFGMDGKSGTPGNIFGAGQPGDDNLVNFADGRLDRYINERR